MGVLLQAFYKTRPNNAVPAPVDGSHVSSFWWDHLAQQCGDLARAGFTALWLPPPHKADGGAGPRVDGYGMFDDYDLGSKNQIGSLPTRYGTREQLAQLAAVSRSVGLDVYFDMVLHQRIGDPGNFFFRYSNGAGTAAAGRFPKNPKNFFPNVPRDPHLGGPVADDFGFGRELAPINAIPKDYVSDGLINAADWLVRSIGAQGVRIDDVKGLSTDFLPRYLNSAAWAGKFAVGEFFDGNRQLVSNWIFNHLGMNGRAAAFDFPLKFQIAAMCNNPGRFNMASLDHAGLVGIAPLQAVTFVENHDTDLHSELGTVFANKLLGYALILTSEGYPCVYYRDYSTDPNCFGLKLQIDNLIWIHEKLAQGSTQQRFLDFNIFAYERLGAPNLLVGLNNDPGNAQTIRVQTAFGANVSLHDYTGHAPDVFTADDGMATITISRNNNGMGYVCYSRQGIGEPIRITSHSITQSFFGAQDLDIEPARPDRPVEAGRIWCAAGTPIRMELRPDVTAFANDTSVTATLTDP
jgi:alpha-amylase